MFFLYGEGQTISVICVVFSRIKFLSVGQIARLRGKRDLLIAKLVAPPIFWMTLNGRFHSLISRNPLKWPLRRPPLQRTLIYIMIISWIRPCFELPLRFNFRSANIAQLSVDYTVVVGYEYFPQLFFLRKQRVGDFHSGVFLSRGAYLHWEFEMERRRSLPALQDFSSKIIWLWWSDFYKYMFCIELKLQDDFKLVRSKHKPKVPKASKDFLLVLQEESGWIYDKSFFISNNAWTNTDFSS